MPKTHVNIDKQALECLIRGNRVLATSAFSATALTIEEQETVLLALLADMLNIISYCETGYKLYDLASVINRYKTDFPYYFENYLVITLRKQLKNVEMAEYLLQKYDYYKQPDNILISRIGLSREYYYKRLEMFKWHIQIYDTNTFVPYLNTQLQRGCRVKVKRVPR